MSFIFSILLMLASTVAAGQSAADALKKVFETSMQMPDGHTLVEMVRCDGDEQVLSRVTLHRDGNRTLVLDHKGHLFLSEGDSTLALDSVTKTMEISRKEMFRFPPMDERWLKAENMSLTDFGSTALIKASAPNDEKMTIYLTYDTKTYLPVSMRLVRRGAALTMSDPGCIETRYLRSDKPLAYSLSSFIELNPNSPTPAKPFEQYELINLL